MIDTCPVADMNIKMVGSSKDELQLVCSWICALLCVKLRRSQVDFSRISKFNMHPIMSLNIKRDAIQLMKPGFFFFSSPFTSDAHFYVRLRQWTRVLSTLEVQEGGSQLFLPMRVHVHAHARLDTLRPSPCASRLDARLSGEAEDESRQSYFSISV